MEKHNLLHLVECGGIGSKILLNEPTCRLVLMSMEPHQPFPERTLAGTVALYVLRGSVSFTGGSISCDLHPGELVTVEDRIVYCVEANEHSVLLIMSAGSADGIWDNIEELDLRDLPISERNSLILSKSDALAVGGSMLLLNNTTPCF